jgi:transcriptional regulator with XRE-family HTH domain
MRLLAVQCRMARAALGLGVRELAALAKVSIDTVVRFERGDELKERTVDALRGALEAAGVEFTNGHQPGVRFAKSGVAAHATISANATRKSRTAGKTVRSRPLKGIRKKSTR